MAQMQQASMQQMKQFQAASTMQSQVAMEQAAAQQQQQQQVESAQDLMHQDVFVPLKQINKVNKAALSEATAMAKMRDGVFELVVNIPGFEPEDLKVYCVDQSVIVKAERVTPEGFVSNKYEQKFNLPDDVDTMKLTSGMSRDGILMIRVPKRASPERVIPIKKEVQIEAVKKALSQCMQASFEISETSAEQIHTELEEKNIVPMNVEEPEDAIKAASAEVVEAMTVG